MRALANRRARVLALAILLAAVLAGVYALGLLIPEEAIAGSYLQAGQAPSLSHPFGTRWGGTCCCARSRAFPRA